MAEKMHMGQWRNKLAWTAEFFTVFYSIRCLILPSNSHAEIWTRLHAHDITGQWNMQLLPSLKWHVWSSLSGNNCHAVRRSLSSSASLCDGTVGFLLCPILSVKLYFTIIPLGKVWFQLFSLQLWVNSRAE